MPPNNAKPCHNCRRRRLRCDRSWPTCHKCVVSGQECLGYGKVFVWIQGIDSQGNVNPPPGRRLPDDADAASGSASAHSVPPPGQQTGQGHSHDRPQPQPQPDYSDQHPLVRLVQQAQQAAQEAEQMSQQRQHPQDDETSISSSDANIPWPSPAALTDPLFQDLDRTSRYYLAHCQSLAPAWRFYPFPSVGQQRC
jgi:hypothetical protein